MCHDPCWYNRVVSIAERKTTITRQGWDRSPGTEKERRKTPQREGASQGSNHMTQVEGAKTETPSIGQARGMAKKEWENCVQGKSIDLRKQIMIWGLECNGESSGMGQQWRGETFWHVFRTAAMWPLLSWGGAYSLCLRLNYPKRTENKEQSQARNPIKSLPQPLGRKWLHEGSNG